MKNPAAGDCGARNADGAAIGAGDPIDSLAARIKATEPLRPLLAQRRWVMWRYEARNGSKPSKAPYVAADPNRHASSKDPRDWCDFETAITAAKRHGLDGVSFALTPTVATTKPSAFAPTAPTWIAAFDCDDCRDPKTGALASWALDLIEESRSYVEITPSGTGLRIIGYGRADPAVHNKLKAPGGGSCEIYRQTPKFVTVTGDALDGWNIDLASIDAAIENHRRTTPQAPEHEGGEDRPADYSHRSGNIPDWIIDLVRKPDAQDRSKEFFKVVRALKDRGWSAAEIEAFFADNIDGIASKYWNRLRQEVDRAFDKPDNAAGEGFGSFVSERGEGFSENRWPEPKPIPDGLLPVAAFDPAFLPEAVAPWVMDISDRMQCPPDFIAIPAMVALGSVIGRKVAVRPQRRTDWYVVPNLWGCIVGRPGAMKSPAMDEALKPLHRLEAEARKANEVAAKNYEIEIETFKLRKEDGQKKVRAALKGGAKDVSSLLATDEPEEPKARRYVVNDATYEALGVILADNPNGTLAFRDELVSLLKNLDREEQVSARGFFLTGWNGTTGYTFDRIIRGKTHIEAACLSLLGSTQPGRLAEYMRAAISGGAGDDGMVQRFSLLVWPDQSPSWENTDRYPASEPRAAAWQAFRRLDELTADAAGAATDEFAPVSYLRLDDAAQDQFGNWRGDLERRLRSGEMFPALESHLAKYRKLVPSLALINHLADGGSGAISETAMLRALAFAEYFETHARRAYGAGSEIESSAAKAILKHIRKGDVQDGFTARAIQRHGWSNLSERDQVQAGLDLLCDLDWLRAESCIAGATGGRPSITYWINPRGLR
jgi:Protein of unknown function (DUF3987)